MSATTRALVAPLLLYSSTPRGIPGNSLAIVNGVFHGDGEGVLVSLRPRATARDHTIVTMPEESPTRIRSMPAASNNTPYAIVSILSTPIRLGSRIQCSKRSSLLCGTWKGSSGSSPTERENERKFHSKTSESSQSPPGLNSSRQNHTFFLGTFG